MAFTVANLSQLAQPVASGGPGLWSYHSADVDSDVNATDYFADCEKYGMAVGDIVFVYDTTTPKSSVHYVSAIDADGNVTTAFAAVA